MKLFIQLLFCCLVAYAPRVHAAPSSKTRLPVGLPPHSADIIRNQRRWRTINLNQKSNELFNYQGYEIARYILDGVQNGDLTPYTNDKLTTKLSKEKVKENLIQYISNPEEEEEEEGWGDNNKAKNKKAAKGPTIEYFRPKQVSQVEFMERRFYDIRRGKYRDEILTLTLIIPANNFATGLRRDVASFSFAELIAYFERINAQALWHNEKGALQCLDLKTVFRKRLFQSTIAKVDNKGDAAVEDRYPSPQALKMAEQEVEDQLYAEEQKLFSPPKLR